MPDDKLLSPPSEGDPSAALAPQASALPQGYQEPYYGELPEEEGGLDWRRYLVGILRYKWLLVLGLGLGVGGAYVAWRVAPVTYTAQGSLWIEVPPERGNGDVSPIRTPALFGTSAWINLLHSFAVLEPVVQDLRLHITAPPEYSAAFSTLQLAERFAPGRYDLRVSEDGTRFALATEGGLVVQEGRLGEPIGQELGILWTPPADAFPPGERITFRVATPRTAAQGLLARLTPRIADASGSFVDVRLTGTDPVLITSTLRAVMGRHVELAAQLKSEKLEATREILEEQLQYAQRELAQAEQDLEEFRVVTITLPSDRSTPINPGLEMTRGPVFTNFFNMQVELERIRRERARLEAVSSGVRTEGVRIEALEVIPAAAQSSELQSVLGELVAARAELRALRERYADDYPPVQDVLGRISTLESSTIPRLLDGVIAELRVREQELEDLVDSASSELSEIPPRTIEEQRLVRRVEIAETLYNDLRSRVETARLAAASSIPDVRILDEPAVPRRPSDDNRIRLAVMIVFGCFGAALGGAILLDRLDSRFRYASDVSREIGLDILGSIPRIATAKGRKGALNAAQALEAFRELRIHTGFAFGSAGPITLTITSPSEGEGKSLIASNLAVAFAEVGRRTLLIDGDTRRGNAHRLVGRNRSPGLIDYLRHSNGMNVVQRTDHEKLDFIGSGPRGASTPELLASSKLATLLGSLKRKYDVIIVDSPPLASGGDPLILASLTGNLAIVIRTGTTEKPLTQVKLDQLARLPIRVLGAILNDIDPSDRYHSYYYYASYLPSYEVGPDTTDEEGVQLISGPEGQAS